MKKIQITVVVEVETDQPLDNIKAGITRGIYRGLDTEPNNIAPPKRVNILHCEESVGHTFPSIGDAVLRDGYRFVVNSVRLHPDPYIVATIGMRGEDGGYVEVGYFDYLKHKI